MRIALIVIAPVLLIAGAVLGSQALAGTPAGERLVGVSVAISGHTIVPGTDADADLRVTVAIESLRGVPDCLVFALDQPFGSRMFRVTEPADGCVRAEPGVIRATLLFDRLSDDDRMFPSHTLVWGIRGGKCGVILPLFGVCAVDVARTVDFELPRPANLPSFPPLGSFQVRSVPLMPTFDLHGVP